jgi:hypothetical protein
MFICVLLVVSAATDVSSDPFSILLYQAAWNRKGPFHEQLENDGDVGGKPVSVSVVGTGIAIEHAIRILRGGAEKAQSFAQQESRGNGETPDGRNYALMVYRLLRILAPIVGQDQVVSTLVDGNPFEWMSGRDYRAAKDDIDKYYIPGFDVERFVNVDVRGTIRRLYGLPPNEVPIGIWNTGCTCYVNTAVQMLSKCIPLVEEVHRRAGNSHEYGPGARPEDRYWSVRRRQVKVICALSALVDYVQRGKSGTDPSQLYTVLGNALEQERLGGNKEIVSTKPKIMEEQDDAGRFLSTVLNEAMGDGTVTDLYGMEIKGTHRMTGEFMGNFPMCPTEPKNRNSGPTDSEVIPFENNLGTIKGEPRLIHIERTWTDRNDSRKRCGLRYEIPFFLVCRDGRWCVDKRDYNADRDADVYAELNAVGLHSGGTRGGHWVADIKNAGRWFRVNDDKVEEHGLSGLMWSDPPESGAGAVLAHFQVHRPKKTEIVWPPLPSGKTKQRIVPTVTIRPLTPRVPDAAGNL